MSALAGASRGVLEDLALSRAAVDRAAHRRSEPELLDRLWQRAATRLLRIGDGRVPVLGDGGAPRLDWVAPGAVDRGTATLVIYLGTDADGVDHLAAAVPAQQDWVGLREVGALLDDADTGLFTLSVALTSWHERHTHCPRCGAPTVPIQAGWTRSCVADGSEHYPRTDPAVIMTVVDDDDRVLLGRNALWPENRFSALAGFVEPGESLEAAVRREVTEESGVVVGEVTYLGNQPWPFPASLMLGFTGEALTTEIVVDGVEVTDARWFSRQDLVREAGAGRVLLPSGISIARRLVEHWYGGPLPGDMTWR